MRAVEYLEFSLGDSQTGPTEFAAATGEARLRID